MSSNTLPSRAVAQTPLRKMYTFVYSFCWGQALDVQISQTYLLAKL